MDIKMKKAKLKTKEKESLVNPNQAVKQVKRQTWKHDSLHGVKFRNHLMIIRNSFFLSLGYF